MGRGFKELKKRERREIVMARWREWQVSDIYIFLEEKREEEEEDENG